jgi:uncharacterized protein GlcG (DUF336 family)
MTCWACSAPADPTRLTEPEVRQILEQAIAEATRINRDAIIAITDREGFLLALWDVNNRVPSPLPDVILPLPLPNLSVADQGVVKTYALVAGAITRASTAAFLSSDQNAFTTRTAGFIIQQHFPPLLKNTPPGPLVGVGFSSLFYSDVNRVKLIPPGFDGSAEVPRDVSPGVRAPAFLLTSLNDSPGGVPLYKDGHLVGGIGVVGDGRPTDLAPAGAIFLKEVQKRATTGFRQGADEDELVALAGQTHFRPREEIHASNVLINGIRIPYVHPRAEDIEDVGGVDELGGTGRAIDIPLGGGNFARGAPQAAPKSYPYPIARLGGYEGEVRFPFRDDPLRDHPTRGLIGKAGRLSSADVKDIISAAADRALRTRAGIRLPIGTSAKVFIAVVSNPDKAGEPPEILGVFRTNEATIFSWDVAVQKARTAVFFSNRQLAMSCRTVGFLAQRFFPPGLDGRPHGPLFGFQEAVSLRTRPLREQAEGAGPFPGNPNLPNGMTIFPGGFPLYRDGYLVGAIGISGDGVDQDDIIGASGCADFLPDKKIRADQYTYRGARLPYAKFPRDPVQ